jgi:phosphocarrier protein HPr
MNGPPVISRTVTVRNRNGLHLRPWMAVTKLAQPYKSKIEIVKEFMRVDVRSIITLMTLAAECGDELIVEGQGEDAESAVAAIADFLAGFEDNEEST